MEESEIIERINTICKSRSWTYYRLAKESGITYSTLCTMLHKSNAPSIPTLIKICNGLGITLAQFFDTGDERVLLTQAQKTHLACWDNLSEENRKTVGKFIGFLLADQERERGEPHP